MDLIPILTSTPVLLFLLLVFLVYKYGTRTHGTLEKLGVPVIPPLPFLGSAPRPTSHVLMWEDLKNARRYGRVWGQYHGVQPQLFIADAEMARRIFIKDFDHFADHPLEVFDIELGRDMLDMLKGDRWKAVRQILSGPLSSAVKLKAMMPTLVQCAVEACRRLDAMLPHTSELKIKSQFFSPMVLDVMAQYSFGIKVEGITEPGNEFVKHAALFDDNEGEKSSGVPGSMMDPMMGVSPALQNYFVEKAMLPSIQFFVNLLRSQVKQRRMNGEDRPDLVGILMDAIDKKVPTQEFRNLNITEEVLLVQGALILMASYSTTGSALSLSIYHLVKNPEAMSKAMQEIESVQEMTYENIQNMPVLDAVLKEVLRITPVLFRHTRVCIKDWEYDGLRVPAGTFIHIPIMPYHMDAKVFPDPEAFDPERWLGEKGKSLGPYHYMPFGIGPRSCPGQRLALLEAKFVLAHVLKRYKFSATEKTQLVHLKGVSIMPAYEPIIVRVEKRK